MKKMSKDNLMRMIALLMAVVMVMTSGAFSSGGWLRATGIIEENAEETSAPAETTPAETESAAPPATVEIEIPAEEPKAPEAPAEEPKTPETPAEEPKAPEAPAEEPKAPETPAEEPKAPEAPAEEPKAPETPAEEPKAPEAPAEEPKTPETPAEEPKAPEAPAEEPKTPEAPAEEPKAPETPAEEPKAPVKSTDEAKDSNTESASEVENEVTYYDVIFMDTHTGKEVARQSVKSGASATFPNHKEYDGFKFEGWFDTKIETEGIEITDLSNITKDLTLYARYQVIGKFTITIQYKYTDGSMAKAPYVIEVEEGKGYSEEVKSPVIQGFTPDQETVVLDHVTNAKTITVIYTGQPIQYTVEHLKQTVDGSSWETAETEQFTGEIGLETAARAKAYTGFTAGTVGNYVLAAAGNEKIQIKYTRNIYTVNYNTAGGSYIEPETYKYEAKISYPADPVKAGYEFDGWKLDTQAAPAVMPAQDIVLTAQWKAATKASYTVVYWQEKIPGTYTKVDNVLQYDYKESTTGSGKVGNTINYEKKNYKGFSLDTAKTAAVTITADGQAVQNVYYVRNTYTITFCLQSGWSWKEKTSLRISAKYGEDISAKWNDENHSKYRWQNPNTGDYYSLMFDMPAENLTVHGQENNGKGYVVYYTQNLDGTWKMEQRYQASFSNLTDEDKAHIEGFTWSSWVKQAGRFTGLGAEDAGKQYSSSAWLKYTRNTYHITFENCTGIADASLKYEEKLSKAEPSGTPKPPAGIDSDYIFAGWYTSPAFEKGTEADWSAAMPAYNLQMFAKWEKPVFDVHFEENGGTDVDDIIDIEKYESIEETLEALDGKMAKENHTFTGWYTDQACTKKFVYTTQIIKDLTLYAGWSRSTGTYDYKVRYVDAAGKEIAKAVSGKGTVGSTVTEEAITVTGYLPQVTSRTLTLNSDQLEIVFVYDKVDTYVYVIKYQDEKGNHLADPETVETNLSQYVAEYKAIDGYVLVNTGQAQVTLTPGADGKAEVIFLYKAHTTGKVIVKYLLQNVEGTGYTEKESYQVTGKTGESYTVPAENRADGRYTGFVLLTSGNRAATGTYTETGSVIELKYDREMLTVGFDEHNGREIYTQTVRYEASAVRPADPVRTGHTFAGWFTDETYAEQYDFSAPVVEDLLLHAKWNRSTSEFSAKGFDVTYDGNRHSVSFNGKLESGESVWYSTDGGEWTQTIPEYTDVCTHSVAVKVTGNGTELWTDTVSAIIRQKDITVTGNTAEKKYNGNEQNVSGLTASGLLSGHTISSADAVAARTEVGTTKMNLTAESTYVISDGTADVTGNYNISGVTDGWIKITPADTAVTVTITEKSGTYTYDGTPKTVTGYTVTDISNDLYKEADFEFSGTAEATGTEAGSYDMNLVSGDFTNINENFNNVTFVIVDGKLTITPVAEEVVVKIKGNSKEFTYDGTLKKAEGYTVTEISNDLYKKADFDFSGNAYAEGTEVGSYPMGLKASDFANHNQNFANVKFEVIDGGLKINKDSSTAIVVTITEKSGTYTYDGTPKTVTGYEVTNISNDLYKESDFTFHGNDTVTATEAGTYPMELKAEDFTNTSTRFENVRFEIIDGTLTINPVENVVVTITGNKDEVVYDGDEHTVSGYQVSVNNDLYKTEDFRFSGKAEVAGRNVDTYPMGLTKEQFTNLNGNFKNVTFKVTDGSLQITPITEEVVVTITENSGSKVYTGKEQFVSGYEVSISNALYKENDFTFKGNDIVKGTEVGTYDMDVKASDFVNTNKNFTNVKFVVVDGQLQITPIENVIVTIKENSASKVYTGYEQIVTGYEVLNISNSLYTAADFTFTGKAEAKGTEAGTYPMEVKASDFANNNKNFKNVTFEVTDGALTITPITDEVVVTVAGNKESKVYNGKEQSAEGYQITSISNQLYKEASIGFTGNALAKGTETGNYPMNLRSEQFKNNNKNFTNVTFKVADGQLDITPVAEKVTVTITENSARFTYDGTEKKAEGYTVTSISHDLYKETDFTFSGSAVVKGTNAGTYEMSLAPSNFTNKNKNFSNVEFIIKDGKLVIDPISEEIVVEIRENSARFTYDGTEKKAEGYIVESISNGLYTEKDFRFTGKDVVKATEVGTYDMEVKEKDFANINSNFTNVKFKINDGTLTITPAENAVVVTITENSGTAEYNGKEHILTGYVVSGINDPSGVYTVNDFEFTGDASVSGTEAGTYPMELQPSDFVNKNKNFKNVIFQIVDGALEITPVEKEVVVTIRENGATFPYDGTEKEARGYTVESISNALYTKADFTFSGNAVVKGINAGIYEMTLTPSNFTNCNHNFANVRFEIEDGVLEITPVETEVVVTITENSGKGVYTGKEQSVSGYTVSINDAMYSENDFTFSGNAVAAGMDAGTYPMEVKASDFTNNNQNFANVKFVVKDGTLTIDKAALTVTTPDASKAYDGTALTASGMVSGLVNGEKVHFETTGSQLYVGSSKNTYELTWNKTAKADNYNVEEMLGTLTVTDMTVDPQEPFDPELAVHKTHSDGKEYGLNEVISFRIEVVNIYDEARTITIEEQNGVVLGNASYNGKSIAPEDGKLTIAEVAPGAAVTAEAAYKVTEEDILKQTYTNTVKVTIGDKPYEETDEVTEPEIDDPDPRLAVEKEVTSKDKNNDGIYGLGEEITYKITVTNTGNLTLTDVVVTDELTNDEWIIPSLAPGAEKAFETKAYTVTAADVAKGQVQNIATAEGNGPEDQDPEKTPDDVVTPVEESEPALTVVKKLAAVNGNKEIPAGYEAKLADQLTYEITVVNNGNVDLTNVEVTDSLTGDKWDGISLKVGESAAFTTSEYIVTEEDILAGSVRNIAAAEGESPDDKKPEEKGEEIIETEEKERSFTVDKNVLAEKAFYKAGEVIRYEIIVKNTGNLTLEDIVITDRLNGAAGKVKFTELAGGILNDDNTVTIASLKPEEAVKLLCEYTVLEADAGKKISNTAIADPKDPENPEEPPVDPKEDETDEKQVDKLYKLTIHYVDTKGRNLAPDYVEELVRGEMITVKSPVIKGYTTKVTSVTTAPSGMPAKNLVITVVYTADEEVIEPTPDPTPTPDSKPEPTPTPEPAPEETTPELPVSQPETVIVDTPQPEPEETAEEYAIVEEDGTYILTPVDEIEIPLADIDLDEHDCCILHFLLMLAAMILLAVHMRNQKKRQARVFELREKIELETAQKDLGEGRAVPGTEAEARE